MSGKAPEKSGMTPAERHVWCYVFLQCCVRAKIHELGNVAHHSEAAANQTLDKLRERGMVDEALEIIALPLLGPTEESLDVKRALTGPLRGQRR